MMRSTGLMLWVGCMAPVPGAPSLDAHLPDAAAVADAAPGDLGHQPQADAGTSDNDAGFQPVDSGFASPDTGAQGCAGDNPAGCVRNDQCAQGQTCDLSPCRPSACRCVDGQWQCSADCAGGQCRDVASCDGPNPQGCAVDQDCGDGFVCDLSPCASSRCYCGEAGQWICTRDCGGGRCLGAAAAACGEAIAPSGCTQFGCPEGQTCERAGGQCAPSACSCDNGLWVCTEDCGGGGLCRP